MSRAEVRKMTPAPVRIAYFNGRFLPVSEVRVPFRDRGFKYGDAVFDTTRTFGHRIFKVREHIDRLYRSLRYLRIDPGLPPATMADVTEEVLRHLIVRKPEKPSVAAVAPPPAEVALEPVAVETPSAVAADASDGDREER